MQPHIGMLTPVCYYHVRRQSQQRRRTDQSLKIQLVSSLHSFRYRPLQRSLPRSIIAPLQRVYNAAALLISGLHPNDHVTPALVQLHWLPCSRLCDQTQGRRSHVPRPSRQLSFLLQSRGLISRQQLLASVAAHDQRRGFFRASDTYHTRRTCLSCCWTCALEHSSDTTATGTTHPVFQRNTQKLVLFTSLRSWTILCATDLSTNGAIQILSIRYCIVTQAGR